MYCRSYSEANDTATGMLTALLYCTPTASEGEEDQVGSKRRVRRYIKHTFGNRETISSISSTLRLYITTNESDAVTRPLPLLKRQLRVGTLPREVSSWEVFAQAGHTAVFIVAWSTLE